MNKRASTILPMLVLLAACSGGNSTREEGGAGEAEGEVLGGSISDEMLPLDSLKSQSPPLKAVPSASDSSETAEEGDGTDAATGEEPAAASELAAPTG